MPKGCSKACSAARHRTRDLIRHRTPGGANLTATGWRRGAACRGGAGPDRLLPAMNVVLPIPDDLAEQLGPADDLARRALEALALTEYQAGRLTEAQLRRMLGFETRYELDGFLKARGIFLDYTPADLTRERETLDRLGDLADHGSR